MQKYGIQNSVSFTFEQRQCDIEPKEASVNETDTVKERKNIYYLNQKRFGDSNKELDIK